MKWLWNMYEMNLKLTIKHINKINILKNISDLWNDYETCMKWIWNGTIKHINKINIPKNISEYWNDSEMLMKCTWNVHEIKIKK